MSRRSRQLRALVSVDRATPRLSFRDHRGAQLQRGDHGRIGRGFHTRASVITETGGRPHVITERRVHMTVPSVSVINSLVPAKPPHGEVGRACIGWRA